MYNVYIIYDNVHFLSLNTFMYHVGPKHINPKKNKHILSNILE